MCKRAFDLIFSVFALVLLAPLCLLIALSIKLSSKGPIFYASRRIGKEGKSIKCWKFRTMRLHAEAELHALLQTNPLLRQEWQTYYKLKNDPRVTRLGVWLRKTSLDELPQFWNVLKGDLSVVGPRPLSSEEVEKYLGEKAIKILSVRPGITGLWQTSGRNLLTYEERVYLEERYVEKSSLLFDLKLICKTIPLILFPKGAY